jgi:8-oxo-dGTP pyrophosphatase MutT (NUDIX family)
MNNWETLSSKEVHKNPWYRVVQDELVMPSGQIGKYTFVERAPTVIILAETAAQELYLVGQYRYPTKQFSWEFPRGTMENKSSDFLAAAKQELLEEVGIEAKNWQALGSFFVNNGLSNQIAYVFYATDLEEKESHPDFTEFLTAKKMKLEDLEKEIAAGAIQDAPTIAAFYKLRLFLQASKLVS